MVQARRHEVDPHEHPLSGPEPGAHHAPLGGPIAQLQADLARRLIADGMKAERPHAVSPTERIVQFVSTAGGYVGLSAGYAIATLAIVYWLRT